MTTETSARPMKRGSIDVECDFCGACAPCATAKISHGKAEDRTFHRFTTADICLECARRAVALLDPPQKVTFCTRCPFAMHLHPTPPEAGNCHGYP